MSRYALCLLLLAALGAQSAAAQSSTPGGWVLTPAGRQVSLGDRPLSIAMSPDGKTLLVGNNGQSTESLMVIDRASGVVKQTISYPAPESLFIGLTFSQDGKKVYASAGGNNKIRTYSVDGEQLTEGDPIMLPADRNGRKVNLYPAGIAISADGNTLFVADNLDDSLSVVDLQKGSIKATVAVGHNPYAALLSSDGESVYVSNWGEQSVSVVDARTNQVRQTISVGTHPSALAISAGRHELYVANTESDSVSVIDTRDNDVTRTISVGPYQDAQQGSSPNALAIHGDTLYVANAGNNDVAVIQLNGSDQIRGLIPTAWYPTALAVSASGNQLYVVSAKGLGAGPNIAGPNPYSGNTPANQYVASMAVGSLGIVDIPDQAGLDAYTQQVVANNGFDERAQVRNPNQVAEQVIPRRPGDPSPIKHVIYVIRENRTFDQVLGSLGKGNGDASLDLFDDASAPNARELARRFVTLDNFYADAEVSADGWNWSTAAEANTYVQKTWPANYSSGRNRPYDFEGGNLATAPGKSSDRSYLWDWLDSAGVGYRNYGFWLFQGQVASTAPRLGDSTDLSYPGYDLTITDQTRMDEFLSEFRQFETGGNLPSMLLVRLPNDHTAGTKPGAPTPRAYMADNDLALGRLVDAVSHSSFWPETAIFSVEDDAQNGPDHVDAHRTVALVVSPYTQTGSVDSTLYSTSSMLRTIELIVGLGPMSQFDAAATPMLASFTDTPNFQPYTLMVPDQPLDEPNTASSPMAAESQGMDFSAEDRAPEAALNQAIWQSVRGAGSEMPAAHTSFRAAASQSAVSTAAGGDD